MYAHSIRSILILCAAVASAQVELSTHLALADCDDAAIGPSGDIYLACHSPAARLPIAVDSAKPGDPMDAFVLRLSPRGRLIYTTRIAGSDYDNAVRIRVDRNGVAYAAGFTKSRDFPVTAGAGQRDYGGGDSDAFLVKIAPDGAILHSTFLGGAAADQGNGLALNNKNVCVGGTTWSRGQADAFVTCLSLDRLNARRSVEFGGSAEEKLTGIEFDPSGRLIAVGYSKSPDFPVLGALQPALRGASDAFIARLVLPRLAIDYSSYFGGSGDDSAWGVTAARDGSIVMSGITSSTDLPVPKAAYQSAINGPSDAFIASFRGPSLHNWQATYFGGAADDASGYDGGNIKLDAAGNIWLAGITSSRDLPMLNAMQSQYGGGETDGFIAAFSRDLRRLCYATFRGGSDRDLLEGIAVSKSHVIATGLTFSPDLPSGPAQVQPRQPEITVAGKSVNTILLALRIGDTCRATETSPPAR